jgi:hypothetical protein
MYVVVGVVCGGYVVVGVVCEHRGTSEG